MDDASSLRTSSITETTKRRKIQMLELKNLSVSKCSALEREQPYSRGREGFSLMILN